MDFRAVHVISMAVSTLLQEITWSPYGSTELHTPVISNAEDYYKLDLLIDVMGTLTRMMDTRITYVTTDGKVVREWIERILEIGSRYRKELEVLERLEQGMKP